MKIITFCSIFVVFLVPEIVEAKNPVILANKKTIQLKDYYNFLQSPSFDSTSEVIPKLKHYLENNPEFDRVYNQLLQFYTYNNKIEEAKFYFDSLKVDPHFRTKSLWMLAKISSLQDSNYKAQSLYSKALHAGTPTKSLLIDFIDFNYQNNLKFNSTDKIESLDISFSLKHLSLAYYYYLQLKYKKTIEELNLVFQNNPENLKALHLLGNSKDKQQKIDEAKLYWEKGLQLSEESDDLYATTIFLSSLGYICNKKGETELALSYQTKALSLAKNIKDIYLQQKSLGFLGGVYYKQNKYEFALNYYNQAIKIANLLKKDKQLGHYFYFKAQILYELGEYNLSYRSYHKSEQYAREINDEYQLFTIFLDRGMMFSKLNSKELAYDEYMGAYEISKKIPLEYIKIHSKIRIALILVGEKKYSEAKKAYQEVLEYYDRIGYPSGTAYIYWKLGHIDYLEKKYPAAKNNFFLACSLATKFNNTANADFTIVYSKLRMADIDVIDKNYDDALDLYNEDIINKMADEYPEIQIEQYSGLADAFYGMKDHEKAMDLYSKAISIIEVERADLEVDQFRIGYFSNNVNVYNSMIQCCFDFYLKKNKKQTLEKIFNLLEESSARALRDLITKDNSIVKNEKMSPDYQEYLKTSTDLRKIQRIIRLDPSLSDSLNLELLTIRYNLIKQKLLLVEGKLNKSKRRIISLTNLTTTLNKANLGLLFYHVSGEKPFVLVVNDTSAQIIRLDTDAKSLAASIDSLMTPFHSVSAGNYKQIKFHADIANRLYKLLIKPIEDNLKLKDRILVVPDITLIGLPLDMLLVKKPEQNVYTPEDSSYYANQFLVNKYSFIYSPSTNLYSAKDSKKESLNNSILVIANPANPKTQQLYSDTQVEFRAGWNDRTLWFADKEAENIKKLHSDATIFKRDKATKKSFLDNAEDNSILHFATHAFTDTVFIDFSGLTLAVSDDSTDDGLLMGYEIADLNLENCNLAVLSACETGVGKSVRGEGLLGLPRIFLGAGVKRVVMTAWKIDDLFSSELMTPFYDNFLNKGFLTSDALRDAKLSLMTEKNKTNNLYYQHPFFWASYSIYGNPEVYKGGKLQLWMIILIITVSACLVFVIFVKLSQKSFWKVKFNRN